MHERLLDVLAKRGALADPDVIMYGTGADEKRNNMAALMGKAPPSRNPAWAAVQRTADGQCSSMNS